MIVRMIRIEYGILFNQGSKYHVDDVDDEKCKTISAGSCFHLGAPEKISLMQR